MLRLKDPAQIQPYLRDASQMEGQAELVLFPENEKEISEILRDAASQKTKVTISAGRSGLTGAAVPPGGWVLSMEKFNRVLETGRSQGEAWARLSPGLSLKEIDETAAPQGLFYAPDPTGPRALLGGTLATNASGPNTFKYGPTRNHIRRVRVVLASGEVLDLRRGQYRADENGFLEISGKKRNYKLRIPSYSWPRLKHAGGYYADKHLDAVDLFIGSEGTLGIISEIEAGLLPKPAHTLPFVIFLETEEAAWRLIAGLREQSLRIHSVKDDSALSTRILEYFDSGSLDFLRPDFPEIPRDARACIFAEQESNFRQLTDLRKKWKSFLENLRIVKGIWGEGFSGRPGDFKTFRSALPLAVRDFLARRRQVKIGTDTAVPFQNFETLLRYHREQVEKLNIKNVTFGHAGDAHVHLNLLPQNEAEAEKARALYPALIAKAVELGGTFSAEHGVGKLKRNYLRRLFGDPAVEEMKTVKRVLDPDLRLGPGNVFEIQ